MRKSRLVVAVIAIVVFLATLVHADPCGTPNNPCYGTSSTSTSTK